MQVTSLHTLQPHYNTVVIITNSVITPNFGVVKGKIKTYLF